MDRENSVTQFVIPGKGRFTVVLQEEEQPTIQSEVESDGDLKRMINESRQAYKDVKVQNTTEFIQSFSPKDFKNE